MDTNEMDIGIIQWRAPSRPPTSRTCPAPWVLDYTGGPSAASAAFTVFLEIPINGAITLIGNRSAR